MAQQFSQSSTSAVGGDLSWVMKNDISKDLLAKLELLNKGEISDPIETEDGFYILQLVGKRKVLTANPLDTVVDLKYLYFPADDASADQSMAAAKTKAESAAIKITECKQLEDGKTPFGSDDAAAVGKVKISDLPANLHKIILDLEVGKATLPIKEDGGYRLFIACGKDAPENNEITYESIENSLSRQRVNLIAKRYLRDLRRDAIIDYR
jgi:peptidyl-prolyl cis-trans isomerase SurA